MRYIRTRPIRASLLACVASIVLTLAVVRVVDLTRWQLFSRRLDALTSTEASGVPTVHRWTFGYGAGRYVVEVRVYPSDLSSGQGLNTAWVFESPGPVRERYIRTLVAAEAESRLIGELARSLRATALRRNIRGDGYAEFLSAAVQDIEYGTIGTEVRLPAEVIAHGRGVCTEKSILLAALLLHEGFDTAVIVLDAHDHVAVGVRSDRLRFRDLPYAYIETTRAAPLGVVGRSYLAWGPIGSRPQTIELGGRRRYGG